MAHPPVCDLGLIGLAVMGQNLVLNMDDHGFRVAVFNRTASKVAEFMAGPARGRWVEGSGFPSGTGQPAQAPQTNYADGQGRGSRR